MSIGGSLEENLQSTKNDSLALSQRVSVHRCSEIESIAKPVFKEKNDLEKKEGKKKIEAIIREGELILAEEKKFRLFLERFGFQR